MFVGAAGFVSPDKLRWKDVIFILDLGVDVTFLVDMVITFHTAIWEVDTKVSPLIQLYTHTHKHTNSYTKVSPLIQLTQKLVSSFRFNVLKR